MDLGGVDGGGHGLDRSCSGYGQVVSCCECGNEPSGSITYEEFFLTTSGPVSFSGRTLLLCYIEEWWW
jgi:hypothetical protein